jgi:hypothetical protein
MAAAHGATISAANRSIDFLNDICSGVSSKFMTTINAEPLRTQPG